jgi:hypothetical protein
MRVFVLFIFALILVSLPSHAETDGRLSSATCAQKVPCLDSPESMSPSDIAVAGNNCVSKSFGYKSVDGLFDEYSGLNANGCLSSKDEESQSSDKKTVPQCCVVKLPDNTCAIRCQLIKR